MKYKKTFFFLILIFAILSACCPDDIYYKIPDNEKLNLSIGDTLIYKSNFNNYDTFYVVEIKNNVEKIKHIRKKNCEYDIWGEFYLFCLNLCGAENNTHEYYTHEYEKTYMSMDISKSKSNMYLNSITQNINYPERIHLDARIKGYTDTRYFFQTQLHYPLRKYILGDSIYYNVMIYEETANCDEFRDRTYIYKNVLNSKYGLLYYCSCDNEKYYLYKYIPQNK